MPNNISTDALFPRSFRKSYPLAVRGRGCTIWDAEGREYLDACGGAAVVSIGHGVQEVVDAMHAQAQQLCHAHTSQFHTPAAAELAALLAGKFPGPPQAVRVHYTSGGSEATETAIKITRAYWLARGQPKRWRVISRRISYHGATLGALGVSGNEVRRAAFAPLLADQPLIAPCFCYRCELGLEFPACELACAHELVRAIERAGPDSVAAFILEPVVGASSGAVPPAGYVKAIREICDRFGILLIADEVMTGAGRTGRYFAMEHWETAPDLALLGKGLASGYAPLGAVLIGETVWRAIEAGPGGIDHGFTYQAHAPALAAGLAVQRYLERHSLVAEAARKGELFAAKLDALRALPQVGDVRGLGLLQTVEFVEDRAIRRPFPPEAIISQRIFEWMKARGVLVYPMRGAAGAGRGHHVLLAPPFIVTEAELDRIVGTLGDAVREVCGSSASHSATKMG